MQDKCYRIVYCTPALYSAGGMERIVTAKANYFAERFGYDVSIIVTEGGDVHSFFPLSKKVKVINLGLNFEELWNKPFWKKVVLYLEKQHQYRKRLKATLLSIRPDITISTLRREINFINDIRDGSLKIGELHLSRDSYRATETDNPSFVKRLFTKWWKYDIVNHLRRLDTFVVLTHNAISEWPELDNAIMIPDPMTLNVTTPSPLDAKRVIAVGRYSYEKGYDILLSVWAMVEKQCEDWQLDIYGMGDPTPYVKRMTELSIDKDRCHLNASLVNVVKEYLHSSILVQPSRFESFGLALVEAMACGLPVVAFDCENGPRAIISDGENGYLVPAFQMETFAARLVKLMKSEELRKEMGERGRLSSEQYHIDKVALQWKELFDELMAERCSTT